jgi:hypothetical protein
VKQLYGSEPEMSWFDTPVVVDNEAGGTVAGAPGVHRGLGYALG